MLDWNIILPSFFTLVGVVATQVVIYSKQKKERIEGIEVSRADQARKEQQLHDRLSAMDAKLDLHNEKLDKHNGFEGRIIALEVIAEWMQKDIHSKE